MIDGYPRWPSVRPDEPLTLHVSTDAPRFRVDFYRQGPRLDYLTSSDWQSGQRFAPGRPDQDWGWPAYTFPIPADWPSGAYFALLIEGDADDTPLSPPDRASADGRDARALFVVRAAAPGVTASILYKLPWATYHAYNAAGGSSMYVAPVVVPNTRLTKVTTRRPGGGTGGALSFPSAQDVYDPTSPREGFAHWDAPFIAWLEGNGYAADYCTDLDLHERPDLLDPYSLLLSVGHDEYWSEAMRASVERFIRAGGNVAFWGGNTCWWRIHFVDDDTAFGCEHPPISQPISDQWWRIRPENSLTGVSYRNGGGWWTGEREAVGYTVQHAAHWVYEGTGLRDGDEFGAAERLVGYECDGARFGRVGPSLVVPTGDDETPPDFAILGLGCLGPHWQDRPSGNDAAATLGVYSNRGTVFTCATTDWARVLRDGEPRVDRITRNVLARLGVRGVRIGGPFPTWSGTDVAVEQEAVQFQVDLADLGDGHDRHFHWTIWGGEGVPLDQPTFRATMPPGPSLVTVTVTVRAGAAPTAFGSRTLRVLSQSEALQVALQGQVRDLLQTAVPPLTATAELGSGNRPLCDPLWNPVRDGLRAPLAVEALEAALLAAEQATHTIHHLLRSPRGGQP